MRRRFKEGDRFEIYPLFAITGGDQQREGEAVAGFGLFIDGGKGAGKWQN